MTTIRDFCKIEDNNAVKMLTKKRSCKDKNASRVKFSVNKLKQKNRLLKFVMKVLRMLCVSMWKTKDVRHFNYDM